METRHQTSDVRPQTIEAQSKPFFSAFLSGVRRLESDVRSRGLATVELALLLPLLTLILLGIIEIGRAAFVSVAVNDAARAGAHFGAQGATTASDTTGINNAAQNDAQATLTAAGVSNAMTVTSSTFCQCASGSSSPNCASSDCSGGPYFEFVQVNTSVTFSPLLSYPSTLPSSYTMNGQAIRRVSH